MNEPERAELARLREQQVRLEYELKSLSQQLKSLEQRVTQTAPQEVSISAQAPAPKPPAVVASQTVAALASSAPAPSPGAASPSPVPPIIPRPALSQPVIQRGESASQTRAAPSPQAITSSAVQTQSPAQAAPSPPASPLKLHPEPSREFGPSSDVAQLIPVPPPVTPTPAAPKQVDSLEMRLGTYWLVRIGVVMVLTGLVFFGNLAYQNYISRLGPGGKVFLLYFASAVLLAAGWWWQRKAVRETLRNYAQVLFAGGLGAVYFTTYAAYHLEPLRVIQSALLDGVLLLACAGFMVWAAERKKSEVLAFFAVGLAYYTSIITRVGAFTLWSNLVLSAAAVFFLVRNRWAALSFGSLVASYAGYGFWRFFDGTNWRWASPEEGLWSGACFLMLYWLVFTTAVFLSRDQKFAGQNRASFLTLNNGAFFTLFLLTMLQVQHGGFWRFSIIYGGVLLGLALLAERLLADEKLVGNTYLTQGLLLVTVGLISKFAGLQLALILAAESVLLLFLGQQRKNSILLAGAYIAAALAVGWGMDGLKQFDPPGLWLGIGLGVMMLANTLLTHRQLARAADPLSERSAVALRPQPSYFAVLTLAIWLVATWDNTPRDVFPILVAAEALVLTGSIYVLGVREVALLSQGLMLVAQAAWFLNWVDSSPSLPWWNPTLLIGMSLALSHWWPRQTILQPRAQAGRIWPAVYAVGLTLVLYLWLTPKDNTPAWLWTTSLLAVGLTVYGVVTRAWFVAACAQLFLAVSIAQFGSQLWQAKPAWYFPFAPIAALSLLSFGTVQWFKRRADSDSGVREPLLQLALIYRWAALVMSLTWICDYVPVRERIWLLALLGLGTFLWAGWRRNQEALLFSAAFTVTALALFWLPLVETSTAYFPNLLVILVLLAQRQIARRLPERYPLAPAIHNAVILIGGLSLWIFVSRWVLEMASGFYLTASWSALALALFTSGLVLRERMYRWMGLGVLACALGRVVMFDVWSLEAKYRVLSFMALGVVLLVLGFIYSKYQEKIKEWL